MTATPRAPAFLSGLTSVATSAVRPASFPAPTALPGEPRSALRSVLHARPAEPAQPPPGPSAEQLAEIRAEAMQQVAHAVQVLRLQAERLAEQARADALEIGFRVARRVLEAELSTSPEAFFDLVRSAVKRAGDSRKISVRVHPDDAQRLAPALAADGLGVVSATVEVVPDSSLEPGDCVVDTDFGKVDGRLRTRFDELQRAATAAGEEGVA